MLSAWTRTRASSALRRRASSSFFSGHTRGRVLQRLVYASMTCRFVFMDLSQSMSLSLSRVSFVGVQSSARASQ